MGEEPHRERRAVSPPREPDPPTDAELLAYVTCDGEVPLEDIALVGGLVRKYVRGLGMWLPTAIEDNRMAAECEKYLRRIGREFRSVGELPRQ